MGRVGSALNGEAGPGFGGVAFTGIRWSDIYRHSVA